MSNRNGRVGSELLAESYTVRAINHRGKLAGFVMQALVTDEDDSYLRGSVFTLAKQPGFRHLITATEQHLITHGEVPYYTGRPELVELSYAKNRMSEALDLPAAAIPAIHVIDQLSRLACIREGLVNLDEI